MSLSGYNENYQILIVSQNESATNSRASGDASQRQTRLALKRWREWNSTFVIM